MCVCVLLFWLNRAPTPPAPPGPLAWCAGCAPLRPPPGMTGLASHTPPAVSCPSPAFLCIQPHYTTSEMLLYTAELKLPRGMPREEKAARVQQLLARLGLQRCQHTVIGSVMRRWVR